MLSREENELFTKVGAGTPMGDMLRRYWHPVGCSEKITGKPQRIKVLGEELVLYRGDSGAPVLMQLRCAHRSLALDYGRVEGDSLRCPYHGWLYAKSGQCLEQPAEPEGSSFKEKIKLRSYPTQELSGLVFAYLGPALAPVLPLYDVLRMEHGAKALQVRCFTANWFNHVENSVDVSHLAWLHGHSFPAYGARKITYQWDRQPYGADNVMLVDGVSADDTHISCYVFPTVNRFNLPPVTPGGALVHGLLYRVPVDDESVLLFFVRFVPADKPSFQLTIRHDKRDEYKHSNEDWWGLDLGDQDRMAVEQQGVIADRPNEHLGASDGGIILMRKMMRESLAAVAKGNDPLCIIRDPAQQAVEFRQQASLMQQRQPGVAYARAFGKESADADFLSLRSLGKRMKSAFLAILLAATVACVLPARADEPIKLKFATLSPAEGPLNQRVLHPWAERVNAEGKGIVEIDVRDGFAIANFDNVYNRVLDDVVQVAFTITSSIAGKFVRSGVVAMPYLYDRPDDASAAFWRLYKTGGMGNEYDEIVPLFICATANAGFHLTRPPIATDNLAGLKIVTSSKTAALIVSALGGTPISLQQSDMYTGLQRKAVDGTIGAWTSFPPYKLGEVTSYHIDAGLGGAPAMVFMAKKTFDALSPAVRKVLLDNADEAQSRAFGAYWQDLDTEVRAQYKNMPGHTTVTLTAAQTSAWKQKLAGVTAQWAKDTPGGEATLAAYRQLLADASAGR